jgi:hypothetical protein
VWIFVLSPVCMSPAWMSTAHAGYADADDGLPTYADRETFLWTNAVRVDPAGFENEYPCNFSSFSGSEQTSKEPLLFDAGLAAAAHYHSEDMEDWGEMSHDSSDGTPWDERVWEYFQGYTIGENVAYGYSTPYVAVIHGWMCSDGHRSNIMSTNYNLLGTGVAGTYYTQDFGGNGTPDRAMAMGLHQPEEPGNDVTLVVDWDGPSAPDEIYAVLGDPTSSEGVRHDLSLLFGSDERGLYSATVPLVGDCQSYHFVATLGSEVETWPETGSYGFGDCAWDDAGAQWLDSQLPLEAEPGDEEPPDDEPGDDDDDDEQPEDDDDDDDDDEDDEDPKASMPVPSSCSCSASPRADLSALLLLLAAWLRLRARA